MVQKIGVIGAGLMGNGIAHVFALAGYDVVLADVAEDRLAKAMGQMERNMDRQVRRSLIDDLTKAEALNRIRTTIDIVAKRDQQIVICDTDKFD